MTIKFRLLHTSLMNLFIISIIGLRLFKENSDADSTEVAFNSMFINKLK